MTTPTERGAVNNPPAQQAALTQPLKGGLLPFHTGLDLPFFFCRMAGGSDLLKRCVNMKRHCWTS